MFLPAPIAKGSDLMAAVDKKEKILEKYMKEMQDLGLDLLITTASLTPAPTKVNCLKDFISFVNVV